MTAKIVKRIKVSGNSAKVVEAPDSKPEAAPKQAASKKHTDNSGKKRFKPSYAIAPFVGTWRYFKNSWLEIKQVRWPNRRATWSLTLAVILFTIFFVIIIVLLDTAFQYLFKEVLLK